MTRDDVPLGSVTTVVGIDLGSSNVKVAVVRQASKGIQAVAKPILEASRPAKGNPLQTLADLLDEEVAPLAAGPVRIVATGYGRSLLTQVVDAGKANEVVATAAGVRLYHPEARTVLDLGAQFTKWIRLSRRSDSGLVEEFASNGLCAAGSGAFLEQQATRLQVDLGELSRLAAGAQRGATIAGRCSVFAKSDMIHLQQKGTPPDEIAYGLCLALARTFAATVLAGRPVEPLVVFAGGGAANEGLVRAFAKVLKLEEGTYTVARAPFTLGAVGACLVGEPGPEVDLRQVTEALRAAVRQGAESKVGTEHASDLPVLRDPVESYRLQGIEDPVDAVPGGKVQAYLGVDVGSVSTNLVLMAPDGTVLQGIYLATKGRPVEVLAEGLARIKARFGDRLEVLAAGATGSGRHLAERLIGMDVVHNEITAQMVSAARFVPEVDTIFEIGGQDSKYIGAEDGHLRSFEMNKICAAGTGSFLEEQAERLGVKIIGEFSERAFRSSRPADLGSHCTVFMDAEVVRALQQGVPVEDICAGLAYSIARNYLERVVAGRPIGRHIVFSGGTASNRAVVAAFQNLLGRSITVHPYNRIAGALGAALLAQRRHEYQPGTPSRFRGLDAVADYEIRTFECRLCPNRCQVNRVTVSGRVAHFGDACERFSGHDREDGERPRPVTRLFERRAELLAEHLPPARPEPRPRLGLPMASLMLEYAPLWATFLDELGFQPVLSESTNAATAEFAGLGLPAEVCLPLKLAAAHVVALLNKGVERIFMPALQELPPRHEGELSAGCMFAQLLPEMLRMHFGDKIVAPEVCLADEGGVLEAARELAQALDRPLGAVRRALDRAMEVQLSFHKTRVAAGRQALRGDFDRAVVVIGKPYNVHDAYVNLDLARHLERLGIPAIPFDTLPLEDVELEERWKVLPWRFNRDQIRAVRLALEDRRLFPLVVSNYGCGPDAFTFKHLERFMSSKPHLVLEFDEHRGEAGMVTRLEAFADEIEEHLRARKRVVVRPPVHRGRLGMNMKRCFIPYFSDHAYIVSALLEGVGIETEVLPPGDEEVVRLAEETGSGRECHPWNLIGGELLHLIRTRDDIREGDAFYIQGMVNPCLLTQYGDGYRHLLAREGETTLKIFDPRVADLEPLVGVAGLLALYEGLLAVDMMIIAAYRFRPYEQVPGSVMEAHRRNIQEIADAVRLRDDVAMAVANAVRRLRAVPLKSGPRRPVVGVAGDLYTRLNQTGNAGLFDRLEAMGCEVWTNPFFAGYEDFAGRMEPVRWIGRTEVGRALWRLIQAGAVQSRAQRIREALDEELREHCVEPSPERLQKLAEPYLGRWTNQLVVTNVGKMVDFIHRGAEGVINAIGINCMVGVVSEAALQAIKRDYPHVPMVTLAYGGTEGPHQKIKLETFVHQVLENHRRRSAAVRVVSDSFSSVPL